MPEMTSARTKDHFAELEGANRNCIWFLTRMALSVGAQGLRSIDGFEACSTTARRPSAAALGCV